MSQPDSIPIAKRTCECRRSGVTLVELLAAVILATMLTVAVLGVLKSMTQGRKALLDDVTTQPWHARMTTQWEWDLTNSRSIKTTAEGVELTGFSGRDFDNDLPLHRPTTVLYSVVHSKEQSILIRREMHNDALNLNNHRTAVVGVNIDQLHVMPHGQAPKLDRNIPTTANSGISDGPLPDRVVVVLLREGESTPVYQHSFFLR